MGKYTQSTKCHTLHQASVIVLIAVMCSQCVLAATPVPAPGVVYDCTTNNTITIHTSNLKGVYTDFIVSDTNTLHSEQTTIAQDTCSRIRSKLNIAGDIQLTGCTYGQPVYLYLMNEHIHNILGGKDFHEYNITCLLPGKGVSANVSYVASGLNSIVPTAQTQAPTISITMDVKPTTASVGDTVTITITNAGLVKYYILPDLCTADDGGNALDEDHKIQLLTNGSTMDSSVLVDFDVSKKGIATAQLYAFKFYTTNTVRINCTIRICGSFNCDNTFTAYTTASTPNPTGTIPKTSQAVITASPKPTNAPIGRRRRSADGETSRRSNVQASFRIVDSEKENENVSGQGRKLTSSIESVVAVCLLVAVFLKLK